MRQWLRQHLLLILILSLALILRLPLLNGSFWLDEAAQALEADRPFNQQLQITDDFQPPLLHLLTFAAIQVERSEWWLRLVGAVMPSLLTLWGTYLLGKKLVNQKVGLLAALLLATNSFFIYFSQELRPYALSCVFVIWSWFFLLEAEKIGQDSYQLSPDHPLQKFFHLFPVSRDFFLFLACTILGLYSSYLYPFVLTSQLLFLLWRKKWSLALYATVIPTVAFLPWLPEFLRQLQAGQALRASFPGWENIVSFSLWRAPALTFGKFLFGVLDLELNLSFMIITGFFVFLVLLLFFRSSTSTNRSQKFLQFRLYFFLLILPFLLASLVSLAVPVIQPKRVIFLLPFLYLLLSQLIFGANHHWRQLKLTQATLLILLLSINLFGTYRYYTDANLQRENWRHALATLHQEYDENTTLALFSYMAPFSPWTWYEKSALHPFATLSTGNYDSKTLTDIDSTLQPVLNYQNIIVFDYLRSLTDSRNLLPQYLLAHQYLETRILDYPNLGFIRIFQKQTPTITTAQGRGE